jgi:hypothetical protein
MLARMFDKRLRGYQALGPLNLYRRSRAPFAQLRTSSTQARLEKCYCLRLPACALMNFLVILCWVEFQRLQNIGCRLIHSHGLMTQAAVL